MVVDEQALDLEHTVNLVKNLTFTGMTIAQTIKGNTEPAGEIEGVVESLVERSRGILYVMQQDEELCVDLISAFRQMAEAMLDENIIISKEYLVAIFKFFNALTALYWGPLMARLDMCQLIDLCWNDGANLYQAMFPKQLKRNRLGGAAKSAQDQQDEKKREDLRDALNFEADQPTYDRVRAESDWRNSIKLGDMLDVLGQYRTPQSNAYYFIVGWEHARVIEIVDEDKFIVGFLGRTAASNQRLTRQTEKIAPYNTYTTN